MPGLMASSSWAREAMVSTSSPLAVEAALWALGEGGTAMDAALASDAVLGVVQPFWTGIGGDAFCVVDDGGELAAFNGSGAAPAGLTWDRAEADAQGRRRLPDRSPLTVTVPGTVDAWDQLATRFGRLGLARVLEPARRLAEGGFPVGTRAARSWTANSARLRPGAPFAARVVPGQRTSNPALAASLARIAEHGAIGHYQGPWATAAARAVADAGGVLGTADLASHRGEWVEPITGAYRGHEICQLPPNGQGAAVLAALARREREPPGRPEDPDTVAAVMLAVREGMRLAYRHVADPRTLAVPAFWRDDPGGPGKGPSTLPNEVADSDDTVYTAVVAAGMAVSFISSVFALFGSGLHAGGAVLQNRGLGFTIDPHHPNAPAPGKRPFHTIIPALVRRDSRVWAVLGVVGGPMQPQGQVQIISQLIDHGRDPQEALDAPRAQWFGGDLVGTEAGLDGPAVTAALRDAGFEVVAGPQAPEHMGAGQVVLAHADGWLEGGADQRRDGVALGR
ncbi:MAG: gamma-glutamyltransferase family protein [Acidimicrobiales bacterium]